MPRAPNVEQPVLGSKNIPCPRLKLRRMQEGADDILAGTAHFAEARGQKSGWRGDGLLLALLLSML